MQFSSFCFFYKIYISSISNSFPAYTRVMLISLFKIKISLLKITFKNVSIHNWTVIVKSILSKIQIIFFNKCLFTSVMFPFFFFNDCCICLLKIKRFKTKLCNTPNGKTSYTIDESLLLVTIYFKHLFVKILLNV